MKRTSKRNRPSNNNKAKRRRRIENTPDVEPANVENTLQDLPVPTESKDEWDKKYDAKLSGGLPAIDKELAKKETETSE